MLPAKLRESLGNEPAWNMKTIDNQKDLTPEPDCKRGIMPEQHKEQNQANVAEHAQLVADIERQECSAE